jgi:uncharacterized protein YqgV (UPF0045/DUF77 family)
MIQATVAFYPLQQADYKAVDRVIDALRSAGVTVDVQTMHTEITGSREAVFQALQTAFEAGAVSGPAVMTATISNACPMPAASYS